MKRLLILATAAVLVGCLLLAYGHFIEPYQLDVTSLAFDLPRLKTALPGKRLVFVADLHIKGNIGKVETRLAETIRQLNPDILILGGDLMGYRARPEPVVQWFGQQLPRDIAGFAVLGDSDTLNGARNCAYCHVPGQKALRVDLPVRFLRNQYEIIETKAGQVVVAGTDPELTRPDLAFLDTAPPGAPVILIAHYPETIEQVARRKIDLILAGDTHGGQIRGPKFLIRFLFGENRAKYLKGTFRQDGTAMYVTRGIGTSLLPLRIGARPEVVVIDF